FAYAVFLNQFYLVLLKVVSFFYGRTISIQTLIYSENHSGLSIYIFLVIQLGYYSFAIWKLNPNISLALFDSMKRNKNSAIPAYSVSWCLGGRFWS
ncbi:MAG: hypothetical protein KBF93_21520, partial [Leptospiraceae bacterium]|nr:hypothetical protein [Leptospiraceae bacterium]